MSPVHSFSAFSASLTWFNSILIEFSRSRTCQEVPFLFFPSQVFLSNLCQFLHQFPVHISPFSLSIRLGHHHFHPGDLREILIFLFSLSSTNLCAQSRTFLDKLPILFCQSIHESLVLIQSHLFFFHFSLHSSHFFLNKRVSFSMKSDPTNQMSSLSALASFQFSFSFSARHTSSFPHGSLSSLL